jgi:hypothetical protein
MSQQPDHTSATGGGSPGTLSPIAVAVQALADLMWPSPSLLGRSKSWQSEQLALVRELLRSNIDPVAFDALVSRELDRRMKLRFGYCFLALTALFTAVSYTILLLQAAFGWHVPEAAIIAIAIETPVQFIGLLYIIARNLFPDDRAPPPPQTGDKK